HHRQLRQRGEAVRTWQVLHQSLPDDRQELLQLATLAGGAPLYDRVCAGELEHDRHVGHLLICSAAGDRRQAHARGPHPVHHGGESNALSNLSFTVKPGETLAIVGRNGAGKTTLFKLICRLYDPNEGRILIDGIDIRGFDPNELRAQIGAMFQDYVTYQATAAENIGLGNVGDINDRGRIEMAGKQGGAQELITGLPEGYDTALGKWFDHGVNLSGGEWQKVALSRAFMRDAKILLLYEPTSALAAQAEYDLFEWLGALTRGRTAVYISHRFSTVRRADRIVFLEHGRLVEEGTHAELMRLNGRYARLFRMQAAAYT